MSEEIKNIFLDDEEFHNKICHCFVETVKNNDGTLEETRNLLNRMFDEIVTFWYNEIKEERI